MAEGVLTRALAARAALRAALVVALFLAGMGTDRRVLGACAYMVAAVVGATVLQRVALVRSRRDGTTPGRCGLEAGLACVALFVVVLLNAQWGLSRVDDLEARAARFVRKGPGLVAVAVSCAWFFASAAGALAYVERRGGGLLEGVVTWVSGWLAAPGVPLFVAVLISPGWPSRLEAGFVFLMMFVLLCFVAALGASVVGWLDGRLERAVPFEASEP